MHVVLLLTAVAVVVAIAVVAAGLGDSMAEVSPDRDGARLPDRALGKGDVDTLRFSVGLRGYRMDEVDDVLDRLSDELSERDRRIDELEDRLRTSVEQPADPAPERES